MFYGWFDGALGREKVVMFRSVDGFVDSFWFLFAGGVYLRGRLGVATRVIVPFLLIGESDFGVAMLARGFVGVVDWVRRHFSLRLD